MTVSGEANDDGFFPLNCFQHLFYLFCIHDAIIDMSVYTNEALAEVCQVMVSSAKQ